MPKSGRLTLVQSVLCTMPIHAMMALDLPMKTIAAMNKVCRGFLWCKRAEANGGNCAVAWDSVCAPKWAGGLGIHDLRWMNVAMQARWPWLKWTDRRRPWNKFSIRVPDESMQIFQAATRTDARNGQSTLLWEDRWLDGMRIQEMAPELYGMIPARIRQSRMVGQVAENGEWATDIGPNISGVVLQQFLELWPRVAAWEPAANMPDAITWSWEAHGEFSVRSAYACKFGGREVMPTSRLT